MENAHLLGHFNALSTAKRLKESYYWPKMLEDVENVVSNCFTCKRTNRAKIYHHPAQALPILGLLERVGIDLVLGLPADNPEQFNGILVITEYLSKYPYAVPIRFKEAVEIATHLFQ
jgi:hypothetical protein